MRHHGLISLKLVRHLGLMTPPRLRLPLCLPLQTAALRLRRLHRCPLRRHLRCLHRRHGLDRGCLLGRLLRQVGEG